MKTKFLIGAALVVLLGGYAVQADTVWTSGHHDIVDGELYGEIYIYNDVTVDIWGGDIYKLETYDVTVTDWYDGEMDLLYVHDDTFINIYGGSLGALGATENAWVELYAYDVIHHPTGGHFDRGWVEGKYLLNDLYFTFDLNHLDTFSHVNVVPEPLSFFLLALGGLLMRKTR